MSSGDGSALTGATAVEAAAVRDDERPTSLPDSSDDVRSLSGDESPLS